MNRYLTADFPDRSVDPSPTRIDHEGSFLAGRGSLSCAGIEKPSRDRKTDFGDALREGSERVVFQS
jgi:hypothetical protein